MPKNRALDWWKPALCGVSMLLYAAALQAADTYIFRASNGDFVRLLDDPCNVVSGWLKMRRAEFRYQSKMYEACWLLIGRGEQSVILLFDEAGDVSPVPLNRFKKEETI